MFWSSTIISVLALNLTEVIQGGSNMTGTYVACLHRNQSRSFEPPCIYLKTFSEITLLFIMRLCGSVSWNGVCCMRQSRILQTMQHTQGDTKERELLKCVVAVKECIRGGGRHLQDIIFKH